VRLSSGFNHSDIPIFYLPQNMLSIAITFPDALRFMGELLPNDLITPRTMAMQ
jgi:hypothetical protein